ncbi:hypothetical protein OTSANNIE_1082 [Anaplasma phagocytophilum str. Annie]|nr:hypothetical protein OTSANNIE_1082 [Anaplasma phagocytophilum str. Annie]
MSLSIQSPVVTTSWMHKNSLLDIHVLDATQLLATNKYITFIRCS